ncbi:hypothetical protein RRG08_035664 [Elysia crispata]|uniref:Uncharacterized protein n=1 Tax=Elysia crispata TaxID=231223 RepID=A0AAE1CW01_9GAST|nr:hypothetical protein RRG08_035664 [Elysia crispata]
MSDFGSRKKKYLLLDMPRFLSRVFSRSSFCSGEFWLPELCQVLKAMTRAGGDRAYVSAIFQRAVRRCAPQEAFHVCKNGLRTAEQSKSSKGPNFSSPRLFTENPRSQGVLPDWLGWPTTASTVPGC